MSEVKHTRGPWKPVVNSADYWEVVHPWPEQRFDEVNEHSPTVVHVCTKEGDEQEANARLIAAAPELLEASMKVLEWFEAEDDHSKADFYQRMQMCRDAEVMIRAAIAKATGGQP